ncbi:hypothetical protein EF879_21655 [Micromonospora sp. HM5-17]|nr:hypothetical protein EF879_21655 [Micromonospora sp. HM5-17]
MGSAWRLSSLTGARRPADVDRRSRDRRSGIAEPVGADVDRPQVDDGRRSELPQRRARDT